MPQRSSSIPKKVYKFVHRDDVWIETNITGRTFETEFFKVEPSGKMTILGSNKSGYAWDGCTPKKEWLDMIIGTPDGRLDYETEKPITYYASMVHDVIYQYKEEIDISKKEADVLFKLILKSANFYWTEAYYFAVTNFGGKGVKWFREESNEDIQILKMSWKDL